MLRNQVKINQKKHLDLVDKIESLYDRLRLDMNDKYKFLSLHQVIIISGYIVLYAQVFNYFL